MVGEQPLTDEVHFAQRLAAKIDRSAFEQALEIHAAQPVADGRLDDAEHLADPGLTAPHPVTGVRGRGEPRHQGSVEVEEGTDSRSRRSGSDHGERVEGGHATIG